MERVAFAVTTLKKRIQIGFDKWISLTFARFGYVKVLYRDRLTPSFSDLEVLQSIIFEALMSGIEMQNPAKAEHLQDIARGIIFRVGKLNSLSINDFIKFRMHSVFTSRHITFTLGTGIACFWEVQTKLLAQQIGVNIFENSNRRNAKSPGIRDIEPIIEDIKKILPKIEFNFGRLINLRNAMVHGNFHQIRTTASESRKREVRDSFDGNVFMASFSNPSGGINLSDITELEEIKRAGLFSWFMDVGNSALFEAVIREFQDGTDLINSVISIKAHSFEETEYLFQKLCLRGESLTSEEKETFLQARKVFDQPAGSNQHHLDIIERAHRS